MSELSVAELEHQFRNLKILNGVTFAVKPGEIFGLLGKNGSGKSTILSLVSGLIKVQKGKVQLSGQPISQSKKLFGHVFQTNSIDLKLTARENLRLASMLYGIKNNEEKINEWLSLVDLSERADDAAVQYSGGMRRRLDIARALVHSPHWLIMDEPSAGLDEHSFRKLWEVLHRIRTQSSMGILLATHRSEEAEQCQRVGILHKGTLKECASPAELKRKLGQDTLEFETSDNEKFIAGLNSFPNLIATQSAQCVIIDCVEGHNLVPKIVESFPTGFISSVSLRKTSLSEVFLKFTGEELHEKHN